MACAESLHRAKEEEYQDGKSHHEDSHILVLSEKERGCSFGNGALDFSAFDNDVVVVDAFLLFDEIIVVAILGGGVGRSVSGGGELDLGDKKPLEEGKPYPYDGTHRDENLSPEIWE